jgi:hypothetical protein
MLLDNYLAGFVMGEPVRQTPRRGDRLFGPATAAKEEAAGDHGLRVTRELKDWQVTIKFKCADLSTVVKPLGTFIAQYVLKNMLA